MPHTAYHPFPILFTPRLLLRQLDVSDAPDLQECRSDEFVMQFICKEGTNIADDTMRLILDMNELILNKEAITWAIILKESGKLIGSIGFVKIDKDVLQGEIGYMLAASYHRMGIMHEALNTIIEYGFTRLNLNSIKAIVHPGNEASISLLKKNRFSADLLQNDEDFFEREYMGSLVYRLPAEHSYAFIASVEADIELATLQ